MFRASNTIDSIKKTQRFHGEQLTKVNDNVEVLAEMVRSLASVNEEEKAEPPAPAVDSDEPSSPPVAAPAVAPAFNTPAPVSTTTPEPVATDAIPSAYDPRGSPRQSAIRCLSVPVLPLASLVGSLRTGCAPRSLSSGLSRPRPRLVGCWRTRSSPKRSKIIFTVFFLTFSLLAKSGWILWPQGVGLRAIRRLRAALLDS